MARLIVKGIEEYLGSYLEVKNDLKLTLLKGELALDNVAIKRGALGSLKIPWIVNAGVIRKIRIKIPWNNFNRFGIWKLVHSNVN